MLKRKINDEKLKAFYKDLKDYLNRIISEKRKIMFIDNVLPESAWLVKNLFLKNNNIAQNTIIPIYRNDYLELCLIIQENGKIKTKFLYKKE